MLIANLSARCASQICTGILFSLLNIDAKFLLHFINLFKIQQQPIVQNNFDREWNIHAYRRTWNINFVKCIKNLKNPFYTYCNLF